MRKHEINYRIQQVKENNLKELDFSSCNLTKFPEEIFELKDLKKIHLNSNRLRDLPKKISQLKDTQVLDLSANRFSEFPGGLFQLEKLKVLRLIDNHFTKIPEGISQLKDLEYLDLSNNQLEELPKEISQLKNLKCLYLRNNQLKELPREFTQLERLSILGLEGNPLEIPPLEIADRGLNSIRNYFDELEIHGEVHIYESKLILVGEPGAGKTSLAEKLLDPGYKLNPTEPMTKGIDVKKWHFPLKNWHFPFSDEIKFRANIWDFGGQAIMHATHRYFLTKRSLYLVMADNRQEDTDFYYWLNLVELLSAKSPILIVLNEKFKYKKYIPSNILENFASIKNIFNVNLADNTGLDDLSKSIKEYITALPHVGKEPIPKKWVEVRKVLEEETSDYISRDQYLDICRKHGIDDNKKALRISEFLHDLGVILHFQKDRILRNIVILNTRWATEAVYLILFNETVIENGGEFDNSDLERIWNSPEYGEKHGDLLQLMINFELCYEIGQSQKYIIPELLPEKPPDVEYFKDMKSNDLLRFEYRYNFMPKGIISRLIVKMNRYIYNRLQWKNGVVLQIENSMAEIVEDSYYKILKIRISGNDRRETLAIIRKEVNEVHDAFENLERNEMVPCNCDECRSQKVPHFYKYEVLKKFEQKGKDKIPCENSADDVEIHSLIRGIIEPKIKEAEYNKFDEDCNYGSILKKRKKIFISYSHNDSEWLKLVLNHLQASENAGTEMDVWDDNKIKAGKKWKREIENAINETKIAILLISTDFLASDFITKNELPPLLEAAEKGGAVILPLIVKPSIFLKNKNLSQFQAVNNPAKPLIKLSEVEQGEILVKLMETIEEYLK